MLQSRTRPQGAASKHRAPPQVITDTAPVALTPEQDLEEFKKYARKIGNSDRAGAMAFLQRAGIMDAQGEIKKQFRD